MIPVESPVDFPHVPFVPFLFFSHLALHLVMMVVESRADIMHFPLVPLILGMHGAAKLRLPMIVPLMMFAPAVLHMPLVPAVMLGRLHRRRNRRRVGESDSRYVQCHPTAESHMINAKLAVIQYHIKEQPNITVTYFIPDDKKAGGRYTTVSGNVRMLDDTGHQIIMADGTNIPIDDVRFIEGSLFDAYEQY